MKPRLYLEANSEEKKQAASVVMTVLDAVLRLLHPVMPFVTEELWHKLPEKTESIMKASWPKESDFPVDEAAVKAFEFVQEAVTSIRTGRSELSMPPSVQVKALVCGQPEIQEKMSRCRSLIQYLARVGEIEPSSGRPTVPASVCPVQGGEIFVLLEDHVDTKKESSKIKGEIEKQENYIKSIEQKLSNEQFVKKAPTGMVDAEKSKIETTRKRLERLRVNLNQISGSVS